MAAKTVLATASGEGNTVGNTVIVFTVPDMV